MRSPGLCVPVDRHDPGEEPRGWCSWSRFGATYNWTAVTGRIAFKAVVIAFAAKVQVVPEILVMALGLSEAAGVNVRRRLTVCVPKTIAKILTSQGEIRPVFWEESL